MFYLLILVGSLGDTITFYKASQGFYKSYYQVHTIERLDSNCVVIYSEEPLKKNISIISDGKYVLSGFEDGDGFRRPVDSIKWDSLSLQGITDMVYYPESPCICVAIPGDGIFQSKDGGGNWAQVSNSSLLDKSVDNCAFSPTDSIGSPYDFNYYTGGQNGVYTKGGAPWVSWEKLPTKGLADSAITDLFGTKQRNSVFAGTEDGIFYYNNSDSAWINLSGNLPDSSILTISVNPKTDFLIFVGTSLGLFYTNDFGNNWNGTNLFDSVWAIEIASPDTIYAGTQSGIYRSIDGGKNFISINSNLNQLGPVPFVYKIHSIEAITPDTVVIGHEQGVSISYNAGGYWHQDNNRMIEEVEDWMVDSVYTIFEESSPSDPYSGIYDLLTNKLGNEPDVDKNGKIYLLLGDIKDLSTFNEHWCASYFDPVNQYLQEVVDTLYTPENKTNYAEVLYVDPLDFSSNMKELRKQLTHSFHRMVHWNYDTDEEEWILMGGDEYSEYLIEYGEGSIYPDPLIIPCSHYYFLIQPKFDIILSYMMYLYENYGGNSVIKDLIQSPYNGMEGVNSVLLNAGYPDNSDDIYMDWKVAYLIDRFDLLNISALCIEINDNNKLLVLNQDIGYGTVVIRAESLSADSIYFNSDDEVLTYLKLAKCNDSDTLIEDVSLDAYNEASIYIDPAYPDYYLIPGFTSMGQFSIDIPPRDFLPPISLQLIGDYKDGEVEIEWDEPIVRGKNSRHLLNYNVYRAKNDLSSFSLLEAVDTTYYLDINVQNESTYYYYVTGKYEKGESSSTDTVAAHPTQFPPPENFCAIGGKGMVSLSWTVPEQLRKQLLRNIKGEDSRGVSGFNLYRRIEGDSIFSQFEANYQLTYYVDSNLINDTTYYYGIRAVYQNPDGISPMVETFASPTSSGYTENYEFKPITIGDLWTVVSNFGCFGDPFADADGNPSYDWPGREGNYYLWEGRVWVGTEVNHTPYVTHCDYGNYEWNTEGWGWIGPGKSDLDIVSFYYDWGNYNHGRAIGIHVVQRALSWMEGPLSNVIAYEFDVVYDRSQSQIGAPPVLDSFYFSVCFDADVSEADTTNGNLDDLVGYDGWTNGEWDTLYYFPSPSDEYTILQDTTLDTPDGIPDQICLFGDDPNENTLLDDTQKVWRDMSFILDGDNPDEPGNDSADYGLSAGFIFASMLYAPESPNDSIWLDGNGDISRLPRPASHQWWNWNDDPGTDIEKFAFMKGEHSSSFGYKFMPHPYDLGANVFDYRFLLTYGPYSIADGDTLHFVLATGIGQGLNGGVDEGYGRGYLFGARQLRDYALMKYYQGSTHSDPYHPSSPVEDIHWDYIPSGVEEKIAENVLSLKNSVAVNGVLSMRLQLKEGSNITLEIYDATGRMVKKIENSFGRGKRTLLISLNSLSSGIYFVRGRIEGKSACKGKVILIK